MSYLRFVFISIHNETTTYVIPSPRIQKVMILVHQLIFLPTMCPAFFRQPIPQRPPFLMKDQAINDHALLYLKILSIALVAKNQILMKAAFWLAVVVVAV